MKILLLGSNGVIGNGVFLNFKKNQVIKVNSQSYNYNLGSYNLKFFKKCDYFIHAAGVTEEEISKYGKKKTLRRANIATLKLLEHLIKKGCKNIIYISSLRVYSDFSQTLDERKTKLDPSEIYKFCHLETEKVFKKISLKKKIKYLILRPGAVYGFPYIKYKINRLKLIPYAFPLSLYLYKNIKLKSSGEQMRNFCLNFDIGRNVRKWIKEEKKINLISNVKGDKTISVKKFALLCIKIYQKIFKFKANLEIPSSLNTKKMKKKLTVHQNLKLKPIGNLDIFLINFFKLLKEGKLQRYQKLK